MSHLASILKASIMQMKSGQFSGDSSLSSEVSTSFVEADCEFEFEEIAEEFPDLSPKPKFTRQTSQLKKDFQ